MEHWDVENALKQMTVLADTREQQTSRAKRRLAQIGTEIERVKLDYGDYSARCPALDLRDKVVIERKMDLNELSGCFCQQRDRFIREFERAANAGARTYLLIENASIDDAYAHRYNTKMTPQAMVANLWAWCARYDCKLVFCSAMNSGKVIRDILYREMKERLERMEVPDGEWMDQTT